MYEYMFVRVKPQGVFSRDFHIKETVEFYAQKGWRFVQAIPAKQNMEGLVYEYDLVFEMKTDR